jgi:hypothetical protein
MYPHRKKEQPMKTLIIVLALLGMAVPAFAQNTTAAADVIDATVSWQQLFGSIIAIAIGGALAYVVLDRMAKLVDPRIVEKAVESFERGFDAGKEKAKQTPELSDDLVFYLAEPIVNAILSALRAAGQPIDPQLAQQLVREEMTRLAAQSKADEKRG